MLKEVFFEFFRKPDTRKYPEVRPLIPEGFRGRQTFDLELCISCGLCARDCPAEAIEMVNVEGKQRPCFISIVAFSVINAVKVVQEMQ